MQLIKEYKSIDEAASVENSFLPMSMNGSNDMMFSAIKKRLSDLSPTLCLLPRIESIINKEDPTLEDILGTCSHDPKLLGKLTRRSGFAGSEEQFARDILFKKGLSFLKSLAIRTMNQEIFEVPMPNSHLNPTILKKRSVILARFLKTYSDDLAVERDTAYLCGLFYNYGYVCNEIAYDSLGEEVTPHAADPNLYAELASKALSDFGFDEIVTEIVFDSSKELFDTRLPFAHALLRIANETLSNTEMTNGSIGRGPKPPRDLVDATGLRLRKIFATLKEITRNYAG